MAHRKHRLSFCSRCHDILKRHRAVLPRYENIPDPESDNSLPVVTITDFATGEAGKEVILLVAGEHARELITSEIVYWLGKLLAGESSQPMDTSCSQNLWSFALRSRKPLQDRQQHAMRRK